MFIVLGLLAAIGLILGAIALFGFSLGTLKDSIQTIQTFFILVGALFGINWFYRRNKNIPRCSIEHEIEPLELTDKKLLCRATITINNNGEVPIIVPEGFARLQKLLPLEDTNILNAIKDNTTPYATGLTEIEWPPISEDILINPGQRLKKILSGEKVSFTIDFVIPLEITAVILYTSISDGVDDRLSWECTTTHKLS